MRYEDDRETTALLLCPVCSGGLAREERVWRCASGHAFDRAREGYVNLLPSGHGRSAIRGDSAEMARARRSFLARPHYAPLTMRLVERVRSHLRTAHSEVARPVVVDAGCGTGHYIGAVARALPEVDAYGFDVSPAALRVAARDHPRITFAVNDVTYRLCLPDESVNVLLNVFAPRNAIEFRRVLGRDGLLLVVVPGEGHQRELRARLPLLDIPRDKVERTRTSLAPAFEPTWSAALAYDVTMIGEEIVELVRMSPSAHHLDDEALADVRARTSPTEVTLSFELLAFRPSSPVRPRRRSVVQSRFS